MASPSSWRVSCVRLDAGGSFDELEPEVVDEICVEALDVPLVGVRFLGRELVEEVAEDAGDVVFE